METEQHDVSLNRDDNVTEDADNRDNSLDIGNYVKYMILNDEIKYKFIKKC